ncbi:hypothetical protein HUA74_14105 [Myxococcus sp. CA051A]|uniref:Vegetative protein n=1 Tax=Myxococcus llanfairpwllgwyngyllgogerychwyrndrobwllllantysiliogogogochensis TaxID=2590453 RepID=A0A540WJJ0_9BACT|nr:MULTISPECIES: hypothetical protein [Myxococcus]NTX04056.1 hypothetical protein [Myxococcus sp. CA040A]NTX13332.1 hypothetical protein [Myxococcus sp. CA056]NTX36216.1 hypothetical protein [Myxococcus sp. CA033]NTX57868.1 hypothetical protein [Myxococcus sp. CA039A]NTX61792.1 hypothetical protein [Myxococcus sp. CA051A]
MARPRKELSKVPLTPALVNWAEALGDAIGRGVLRAMNQGIPTGGNSNGMAASRRRGRPPKALAGNMVASDRRCTMPDCTREQRSKGLCSAHYQAERRRLLAGGKPA